MLAKELLLKNFLQSSPTNLALVSPVREEYLLCYTRLTLHVLTDTTRAPREGESNGKDYHFVSPPSFRSLLQEGGFIEHAEFSGNLYGTSKQAIRDVTKTGRRCILDIEAQVCFLKSLGSMLNHESLSITNPTCLQGIRQVKTSDLNPVYLFISPPSMTVLRERLRGRGTDTDAAIQKRLAMSVKEIEYAKEPNVHDIVIINDDLDKAYREFKKVALGEPAVGDVLPALDD